MKISYVVNIAVLQKIELREDLKSRRGLAVSLEIICHNCEGSTSTMSSKISNKCYDVNLRLTYGMRAIGKGGAAARIFCGLMNLPPPPAKNVNSVRLPKLQIDKYFDDSCLRLEFWNKFQNSIDQNETLTKVDKFSYLKSLLGGVAGNVVYGFALSDDNYENALILLKERFGREEIVVSVHMSKLLNLYPVKDSNKVIGLRKLYDICKIQIRSLESLNVTSGMYGHLLQPILLKLLPKDVVLDFNRKQLGKKEESTFNLMELLQFLKIETECRESAHLLSSQVGRVL
ncbi:uncharacterized protein TNCV_982401 [Trichonephila clavipes]|nr:uncharacterized protein TNCV_982401 [Trichonephila clavipes]